MEDLSTELGNWDVGGGKSFDTQQHLYRQNGFSHLQLLTKSQIYILDLLMFYVYLSLYICLYKYIFVGCVVLVINKSTTKQNNMRHST